MWIPESEDDDFGYRWPSMLELCPTTTAVRCFTPDLRLPRRASARGRKAGEGGQP